MARICQTCNAVIEPADIVCSTCAFTPEQWQCSNCGEERIFEEGVLRCIRCEFAGLDSLVNPAVEPVEPIGGKRVGASSDVEFSTPKKRRV